MMREVTESGRRGKPGGGRSRGAVSCDGGKATPAQIGGFLTALRVKGRQWKRSTGPPWPCGKKAIAICRGKRGYLTPAGPGATGAIPLISPPPPRFVVTAAGVPVAKHGNRAVSSACGGR